MLLVLKVSVETTIRILVFITVCILVFITRTSYFNAYCVYSEFYNSLLAHPYWFLLFHIAICIVNFSKLFSFSSVTKTQAAFIACRSISWRKLSWTCYRWKHCQYSFSCQSCIGWPVWNRTLVHFSFTSWRSSWRHQPLAASPTSSVPPSPSSESRLSSYRWSMCSWWWGWGHVIFGDGYFTVGQV